jgi:hypothetical protein
MAMLIFTAIEVSATPFCWELLPINKNKEINKTPDNTTKIGQFPVESALLFHSLPKSTIPQINAVK